MTLLGFFLKIGYKNISSGYQLPEELRRSYLFSRGDHNFVEEAQLPHETRILDLKLTAA